ncbi:hypothetical protein [Melittangium boletus]
MLHDLTSAIRRKVRATGQGWAREYRKTGGFTQPQRMLQVLPGEVLIMDSVADSNLIPRPRWRIYMLLSVFMSLNDGVPKEERQRMEEAFESFCLSTPWGALDHAVSPLPPRSAKRMARRLAALLRFWDVLQGPRYTYRVPDTHHTLDELIKYIYSETLDAWCPGGPTSVREHLALTVERMSRATRDDCMEALLRVIPALVEVDTEFKHREVLCDPGFLRECLNTLSPKDFEDVSSAYKYTVTMQLAAWDRQLE